MPQSFGSRLGPAFIFCVYSTFGCQSSEVDLPKVDLDAVLLTAAAGDVIELGLTLMKEVSRYLKA